MIIISATPQQADAILGAMWAVAEAAGPTEIDRGTLVAARRVLFGQGDIADKQMPAAIAPTAFAAAVPPVLHDEAMRALIVMALVDGSIDAARIDSVSAFAAALGSTDEAVADLVKAAHGRIEEAKADMIRANMASITNAPWSGNTTSDVGAYLLPYQGDKADPALVARFEALGTLPEATFGWRFWRHFTKNGYAFPGDPKGLNILFSIPHDSCHVLADYDTSAEGEMLTSTFTAAMHPRNSMAAHVLPVIFAWHLGVAFNDVIYEERGGLKPGAFFEAWQRGAATNTDFFSGHWDFWSVTRKDIEDVRAEFGIAPRRFGLDA